MLINLRLFLTLGVAVFVIVIVGGIGTIGTYGSITNALSITRQFQSYRAATVTENVVSYFASVEAEVSILYDVFEADPALLNNSSAINLLTALVSNLESVRDLTLLRRDGTNVMVYRESADEIGAEFDGELDEDDIALMVAGRPGDESEGFGDLYIEPVDKRPVISYTFHLADSSGQSLGTIFLDVDVATLSEAISTQIPDASDYVFMIDSRGVVMAHPELLTAQTGRRWDELPRVSALDDPVPAAVMESIKAGEAFPDHVTLQGQTHLTTVSEITSIGDNPWFVVSAIPREAVLGDALSRARMIGLIGLITLLVSAVTAFWVGRLITTPISRLASAANAIQEFELQLPKAKTSIFEELDRAERAFSAMLEGLQVFARYVPKNLVRILVRLEADSGTIAPENREVTILFTDLAGFTEIASTMGPAELAALLNEYFSLLTVPVLERDGTVDKFIGDALMAFWNAPVPQNDHADRAIAAAMAMRQAEAGLNAKRRAQGLPPLLTRIGIHTGKVLVGNIGASERLNYTIVGDAVNAASRLEALGKEVGFYLCVSGETRAAAEGTYAWRKIGTVRLRGRGTDTIVYTIEDKETAATPNPDPASAA